MIGPAPGTKVYIGTTTAATTLTAYKADTWVEIGQVETVPDHGDRSADITANPLNVSRTLHFPGNNDAGTLALAVYDDSEDAGQQALVDAYAAKLQYNFKILLPDKITNSGTGTGEYFSGRVMSKQRNPGSASSMRMRTFTIGINTEILEDPAT